MAHPATQWYIWLFTTILLAALPCLRAGAAEITKLTPPAPADACDNATISCTAQPVDATLWWTRDGGNVTLSARVAVERETKDKSVVSHLRVHCAELSDQGNYTCHVSGGKPESATLRVRVGPELVSSGNGSARLGGSTAVLCSFRGSPLPTVVWSAGKQPIKNGTDKHLISVRNVSSTEVESQLTVFNVSAKDGGELTCEATNEAGPARHTVRLVVQKVPEVTITKSMAFGKSRIFVSWTVADGNAAVTGYRLQYMLVGSDQWLYWWEPVPPNATSAVLTGLEPSRGYRLRLAAENAVGFGPAAETGQDGQLITQDHDPTYTPRLSVKAATSESLTLSWTAPPKAVAPHVQSYRLMRIDRQQSDVQETTVPHPTTLYLWPGLASGRAYKISVRACNDLVRFCGKWSEDVLGTTMADLQENPRHVALKCRLDRDRLSAAVLLVTWEPPASATVPLPGYTVTVTGISEYRGQDGRSRDQMNYGPETQVVEGGLQSAEFRVDPNTNYTVRVCTGVSGAPCLGGASGRCQVGAGLPAARHLHTYNWWRVRQHERWLLLVQVDRVTERSGPICCYRIVMVRLADGQELQQLPRPADVPLLSYEEVQARGQGAYLADAFGSDFAKTQYVTLGDGQLSEEAACGECQ